MAEYTATIPRPQRSHPIEYNQPSDPQVNVGDAERWLSVIAGGAIALYALQRSLGHLALLLGGGALIYRGLTGHCDVYQTLGVSTTDHQTTADLTLDATITVNKPASDVYAFWRRLENHPRFVKHLESVVSTGEKRSHWKAKVPMQGTVEWDAEIVEERQNALISWRSLAGADVDNAGTVRFRELPNNRGTEVYVNIHYAPPGGVVGVALGTLFKTLTVRQLQEDLRHFKQLIEAGETATTTNQPSGRH